MSLLDLWMRIRLPSIGVHMPVPSPVMSFRKGSVLKYYSQIVHHGLAVLYFINQYSNPKSQRGSFAPFGVSISSEKIYEFGISAIWRNDLSLPPISNVYLPSILKSPFSFPYSTWCLYPNWLMANISLLVPIFPPSSAIAVRIFVLSRKILVSLHQSLQSHLPNPVWCGWKSR